MNKYGKKWIPDTNEKRLHELCLTFLCDNLILLDIKPFLECFVKQISMIRKPGWNKETDVDLLWTLVCIVLC